jgi:hypothetical protein
MKVKRKKKRKRKGKNIKERRIKNISIYKELNIRIEYKN